MDTLFFACSPRLVCQKRRTRSAQPANYSRKTRRDVHSPQIRWNKSTKVRFFSKTLKHRRLRSNSNLRTNWEWLRTTRQRMVFGPQPVGLEVGGATQSQRMISFAYPKSLLGGCAFYSSHFIVIEVAPYHPPRPPTSSCIHLGRLDSITSIIWA